MKLFVVYFSSLLALVLADGYYYIAPQLQRKNPLLLNSFSSSALVSASSNPIQQQYQTQDELGQYAYGYSEPLSTKQEVRSLDGITRGSYSYVDGAGIIQRVDYTADASGFHVTGTNLPKQNAVEETPEVAAARAQHLAAHQQAKLRLYESQRETETSHGQAQESIVVDAAPKIAIASPSTAVTTASELLPRPVEDTPEVAAAKLEFFKLYEAEKLRHQLLRTKQKVGAVGYTLLKSNQPIAVALPLSSYHTEIIPSSGFHYNYKLTEIPALKRAYLPVV